MIEELKKKVEERKLTVEDIHRAQEIRENDPQAWEANAWVRALAGAHEVDAWLYGFLDGEIAQERVAEK